MFLDITMCQTENCDRRDSCYRYRAIPNKIQSYSNFEDICKAEEYSQFLEILPEDRIKKIK